MSWHVFVGPTLPQNAVREVLPDAVVHRPISLGDLARIGPATGDGVIIIDGFFHQQAPVRHKEIVMLLAEGVTVIGAASMGALRAAELSNCGMIGVGQVYRWYANGFITRDDEVAVAHSDEDHDHRPLSVALVDIRHACDLALRRGLCTEDDAGAVVEAAAALPYTSRNWRRLESDVRRSAPSRAAAVTAIATIAGSADERSRPTGLKASDALLALRSVAGRPRARATVPPWATSGTWRTSYLDEWIAAHAGSTVDGTHVGKLATLGFVQIHDADFPRRWRRCVLDVIGGAADDPRLGRTGDGSLPALASAARRALATGSDHARQHWLTGEERLRLDPAEADLRVLIRSGGINLATIVATDEARFAELVGDDKAVGMRVAACLRANDRIAGLGVRTSIADIKDGVLRDYLRMLWFPGSDPDEEDMIAAARDRAFTNLDAALCMARTFVLEMRRSAPTPGRYR